MGKMLPMLLLIVSINLGMVMFLGVSPPGSTLWTLVNNPQDWSNSGFMNYLIDALALVGVVGIIIGTFTKAPDFITFAGISAVLLSFGFSIAELYTRINQWEVLSSSSSYIAIIITAPLLIAYLYIILKFWRNAD